MRRDSSTRPWSSGKWSSVGQKKSLGQGFHSSCKRSLVPASLATAPPSDVSGKSPRIGQSTGKFGGGGLPVADTNLIGLHWHEPERMYQEAAAQVGAR
mmetsp:Transcript_84025/g.147802  ORF Transcript_84025/g.147802 Transcript_84025/m.147802 type:complete len:98 (+) Transcript_84025:346-639(+)